MERLDLYCVRHARSIHDKGVVPPHNPDSDLSDQDAFDHAARILPAHAEWWVSPLKRCQMTAETLISSGAKPLSMRTDDRLTEQDYGSFHGRAVADVWDEIKDGPKSNWHFLHSEICPPEGESFTMLHDRMAKLLSAIETLDISTLVLVAHAMVFKSLIAHALNLQPAQAHALGISPLSVSHLTFIREGYSTDHHNGGRWSLNFLNSRP